MKKYKYIAELIKWTGETVVQEIQKDWIDDVTSAVVGQYSFYDKVRGFGINGGEFRHVNVYEVEDAEEQLRTN